MFRKLKTVLGGDRERRPPASHDEILAVCAILVEVAQVDEDFHEDEWDVIVEILMRRYGLGLNDVETLVQEARENRHDAGSLEELLHPLALNLTADEKFSVLTMVWRVIYADAYLHPNEQVLADRLRDLLGVDPQMMAEARRRGRPAHHVTEGVPQS